MVNNNKRNILAICITGIIYILLLIAIVTVEGQAQGSSITSLGDAFWYSIVTLTSVGYGDIYPVTTIGRLLGAVFVILSVGLLALIFSFIIRITMGQLFPVMRLTLRKNKDWYIFTGASDEVIILAKSICNDNKNAICIFTKAFDQRDSHNMIFADMSVEKLKSLGNNVKAVFVAGRDNPCNFINAKKYEKLGIPVYCDTDITLINHKDKIRTFNRHSICARLYWQNNLPPDDITNIAIIGFNKYGRSLLQQALIVNIFDENKHIKYHVFSQNTTDADIFINEHPLIREFVSVNEDAFDRDCIFFHNNMWNQDFELISSMDRIIICTDIDEQNISLLSTLVKYYPSVKEVHVRLLTKMPHLYDNVNFFGSYESIYSKEFVVNDKLNEIARSMHEIYLSENPEALGWDELSTFTRESNIAAADHLFTKIAILKGNYNHLAYAVVQGNCEEAFRIYESEFPKNANYYRMIEHRRWMRFYYMHNWQYGNIKDDNKRLHPLLTDYHKLSDEDKEKDDYAWKLLGKICTLKNTPFDTNSSKTDS